MKSMRQNTLFKSLHLLRGLRRPLLTSFNASCQVPKPRLGVSHSIFNRSLSTQEDVDITDFNNCREYIMHVVKDKSNLTHSEWQTLLDEITNTLPASDVVSTLDIKVKQFDDLVFGKKREAIIDSAKYSGRRLTEHSRDLFLLQQLSHEKKLDLVISLADYLQSKSGPGLNQSVLCHLLRVICNVPFDKVTPALEKEFLRICTFAKKQLRTVRGDEYSFRWYLLGALAKTRAWREGLKICEVSRGIRQVDLSYEMAPVKRMSVLIRRCLIENDLDLMWSLMANSNFHAHGEALRESIPVTVDDVILDIIQRCKTMKNDEDSIGMMNQLFQFFSDVGYLPRNQVPREVKSLILERLPHRYTVKNTYYMKPNICLNCKAELEPVEITEKESSILFRAVHERLVKGQDLYRNTTQVEQDRFFDFIQNAKPFTLVIDGLNVSLAAQVPGQRINETTKGDQLLSMVRRMVKGGHSVAVLGRVHQRKYKFWSDIESVAQTLLFDNVSEDDPFIILATLSQGPNTLFMTNDLFRQHHYNLGSASLRKLFTKWQMARQIKHRIIREQRENRHKTFWPRPIKVGVSQFDDGTWHLPLATPIVDHTESQMTFPKDWLCIAPIRESVTEQ